MKRHTMAKQTANAHTAFDTSSEEERDEDETFEKKVERRRARRQAIKTWLQPVAVTAPDGTQVLVRPLLFSHMQVRPHFAARCF
jgi:hypothetical protein